MQLTEKVGMRPEYWTEYEKINKKIENIRQQLQNNNETMMKLINEMAQR